MLHYSYKTIFHSNVLMNHREKIVTLTISVLFYIFIAESLLLPTDVGFSTSYIQF